MSANDRTEIAVQLRLIAQALERLAPTASPVIDWHSADAFLWQADGTLVAVKAVNRVAISLLKGIDFHRDTLLANTTRFARGLPANNALLWGARGTGKSSLVKAVHHTVAATCEGALKLIEIHREDIDSLPVLMKATRAGPELRFIVFCDDLSFDGQDTSYKSLKGVLEGGIEGRPANVVFYATSNRRHLMARHMIENERSTAINPSEVVEEKVSLSDRFGLWIGFHNCDQADYLAIVHGYAEFHGLKISTSALDRQALEWAATRGARSGRVAWQFIQDLAGRLEVKLSPGG